MYEKSVVLNPESGVFLPEGEKGITRYLSGCDVVLVMSKHEGVFSHFLPWTFSSHVSAHKEQWERREFDRSKFNEGVMFSSDRDVRYLKAYEGEVLVGLQQVYTPDLSLRTILYPAGVFIELKDRFVKVDIRTRSFSSWFESEGRL